jgi:cell division protein FtsI (penicillin-binding protein 3)
VQGVFAIALLALLVRAAQVQILQGARHAATARAQRTERKEIPARRGALLDRNGTPLALTRKTHHVNLARREMVHPDSVIRLLVRYLGVSRRQARREVADSFGYLHGPFNSLEVEPLQGVPGVHVSEPELQRHYSDPELARAVIGRPAEPGRPASGLERILDSLLTGRPGSSVVLHDRLGNDIESPIGPRALPVAGHTVFLTIDARAQEIAEWLLQDGVEQYEASGGDVVVLDPKTGEILAVASVDARGRSTADAFTSQFEPGSTAKLFLAAALMEHGLARETDSVWAEEGVFQLGGRVIHDEHPSGWLTLAGVIEQSSNIGIAKFAERLSAERQFGMLRDFGLGAPTGVEYPSESGGRLWKPHQWSGTTPASLAMGYEVAVTALQLAQAYGAIANDGVMLQPTLIREVRSPDGRTIYRHVPEPVRRVLTPEVARALRAMLHGVVYRGGTARNAALTSYELAGKTGTARRAGPGGYVPGAYYANFAALFPADDPQLVMVVKLVDPEGGYARLSAAPLTRAMVEQLLAARSGVLDRSRLAVAEAGEGSEAAIDAGTVPYVVEWPLSEIPDTLSPRRVPDVVGRPLRDAARRLHEAGLRVRVVGWGVVRSVEPRPGTTVEPGSLITVRASERR